MKTFICLLRGINVSGKNKIKMAELRTKLSDVGLVDVSTYIQSGNILFKSAKDDVEQLATEIKGMLMTEYGYEVPVLVRSSAYWNQVAEDHPFQETGEEPLNQLYVTFLKEKPSDELLDSIKDFTYKEDVFLVNVEAEHPMIYVYCPGGYGTTKLNNNFFERKLKVQATTRNWKSVQKIKELISNG